MTAGSSTASRRTSSRSKGTARRRGSKARGASTPTGCARHAAPRRSSRTASSTSRLPVRNEYVARFNEGVRTGDWSRLLELVTDDCELEFVGIPVGPFHGRDAIAAAYREQPPDDEIVLLDGGPRYAWAGEPAR